MTEVDELCSAFEAATLRSFDYLRTDYGFTQVESGGGGIEDWILFKSPAAAIRVMYEVGGCPWVQILRLRAGAVPTRGADVTTLELLLEERDPTYRELEYGFGELSAPQIAQVVAVKAAKLREFGEDVLKGDFQVFGRLAALAEANLRRRERKLSDPGR